MDDFEAARELGEVGVVLRAGSAAVSTMEVRSIATAATARVAASRAFLVRRDCGER
jgi:hypothetical protein